MKITFVGAAGGVVTGSCHLLDAAGNRVLLDCGMVQGSRDADEINAQPFAFEPTQIDALVLSHAHIDHIGRVPLLVKRGFTGPIFAQAATCALLPIMLLDAANIAFHDADHANRHLPAGAAQVVPLFDSDDVQKVLGQLHPLDYEMDTQILPGIQIRLHEAGHILGSSVIELHADEAGGRKSLLFSGDIGMRGTPILRDPATPLPGADIVLMESTYGDRNHKDRLATVAELGEIFNAAKAAGGNVLIPAFAVGRTQELLYWFAQHFEDWKLADWKIFLDSPMAAKVTAVYDRHHDLFDPDARNVWDAKINPFKLPNLSITSDLQQSMAINQIHGGAIVVAGSGMANAGRIRHHLRNNLANPATRVIFVGYQADGTLGRLLVNGLKHVKLFGQDIPVNAKIHTVGGLSAHADQNALLDWYGGIAGHPPVALVHGENPAREALAQKLRGRFGVNVTLSEPGMTRDV